MDANHINKKIENCWRLVSALTKELKELDAMTQSQAPEVQKEVKKRRSPKKEALDKYRAKYGLA